MLIGVQSRRGYSDFGRGIGDLVKGINDLSAKKTDKANLAALSALVGDGKALLGEATRRGVPLDQVREMVGIHSMLAGKEARRPVQQLLQPHYAGAQSGAARIERSGIARGAGLASRDYRTSEQAERNGFRSVKGADGLRLLTTTRKNASCPT